MGVRMIQEKLLRKIVSKISEVLEQKTVQAKSLWQELLHAHPADIAQVINSLDAPYHVQVASKLPLSLLNEVFYKLHHVLQKSVLQALPDNIKIQLLQSSHADDLTDLFDDLSDDELKSCLELLHKKDRQKVLSLMKFPQDSAGGIMHVEVVTLRQDFTLHKSVRLLQRLSPSAELHYNLYVTDEHNRLIGFVKLEDLVLKDPQTRLSTIMHEIPFVAYAHQDQEEIAKTMVHYDMMIVPVVNEHNYFLGVIPGATLVDVLQQEAGEDVQKISGSFLSESYFDTSFFSLLWRRGSILAVLLIAESLTSYTIGKFEATLTTFLLSFIAMLVSTGGNTSSQTSAIVIQGMSSGTINDSNLTKFLRRELLIGSVLAVTLSSVAFSRVYFFHHNFWGSFVVALSLGIVVLLSVLFGSAFPVVLKKMRLDPAFSAGPFLATLMDILGILVYCYIASLILS